MLRAKFREPKYWFYATLAGGIVVISILLATIYQTKSALSASELKAATAETKAAIADIYAARLEDKTTVEEHLRTMIAESQEAQCVDQNLMLNNGFLNLRTDNDRHTLDRDILNRQLSAFTGTTLEATGIQPDLRLSNTGINLSRVANLSILAGPEKFEISLKGNDDLVSHAIDFLITTRSTINESGSANCLIPMRLHFAETFDNPGYSITSVIGRNGIGQGYFSLPYGTEIKNGRLWVTDCSNENISVFELDGRFVDSFGYFGEEDGNLDTPADLKIKDGLIYVVEERNHRVQVFDMDGTFQSGFGAYGVVKETPDQDAFKLNNPLGIAVSRDTVLVVDYGNNRVVGYDKNDSFKPTWISHNLQEGFGWYGPYYAEYLSKRNQFVVVNRSNNEIALLTNEGERIKNFGSDVLNFPHEVAWNSQEDIFVADMNNHQVVRFLNSTDYETHEIIKFPESYGLPKTIAIDEQGRIVVGFVGNGVAYFLVLSKPEQPSLNFENYVPVPILFASSSPQLKKVRPMSATAIYQRHCVTCHEGGRYDAPARGNIEAWDRFPRDVNLLVELAIEGKGAMIPKGGCQECSKADLKAVIEYMLPMTWGK